MATISASRVICRLMAHIPEKHYPEAAEMLKRHAGGRDLLVRREAARELKHLVSENNWFEESAL